jgi:hypothetical protein
LTPATSDPETKTVRQRALEDAANCVLRDRNATHGEPEDSFPAIARGWSVLVGKEITATQACLMLAWLKIVRANGNPDHFDNYSDLLGYGACAAECAQKEREKREQLNLSS